MIRIETGESSPSRRTPHVQKQKPAKRPNLLKRIFGSKDTDKGKPAKCVKMERCPALADEEMLLV